MALRYFFFETNLLFGLSFYSGVNSYVPFLTLSCKSLKKIIFSFLGPPALRFVYSGPDIIYSKDPIKTSMSVITSMTLVYLPSGPFFNFFRAFYIASFLACAPGESFSFYHVIKFIFAKIHLHYYI